MDVAAGDEAEVLSSSQVTCLVLLSILLYRSTLWPFRRLWNLHLVTACCLPEREGLRVEFFILSAWVSGWQEEELGGFLFKKRTPVSYSNVDSS